MSPSFCKVIKKKFSHYEDFNNFPGQIHFLMIIGAYNNSAAIDIEGAEKAFTNLPLNDFTGENISDLDT